MNEGTQWTNEHWGRMKKRPEGEQRGKAKVN